MSLLHDRKKVFEYASQGRISSRNNYARLKAPFRKKKNILIYWSLGMEQITKFNEKTH